MNTIRKETLDRFGLLPESVENIIRYGALKCFCRKVKIRSIDRFGSKIVFKFFPSSSADVGRLQQLIQKFSGSITPQGVLSLTLSAEDETGIMNETIGVLKELTLM